MAQLSSTPPAPATTISHSNGHVTAHSTGSSNGHSNGSSSSGAEPISRHMLCVSPDYCVNVPLAYLGSYAAGRFDFDTAAAAAAGPQRLDLGDILYAPNILTDDQVRAMQTL
jgi:hypothetical protein